MVSPSGPRRLGRLGGLVLVLAVVLALGATAVVATTAMDGEPDPTSPEGALTAPTPPLLPEECASREELVPVEAKRCDLVPYEPGRPTLVLWGDSHAWQLVPALQAAVAEREVNLVGFLFGSCPVMAVAERRPRGECARTNRLALSFVRQAVRRDEPVRLVVSQAWELYRNALDPDDADGDGFETPTTATIADNAPLGRVGTPRLFRALGGLAVPTDVVGPLPMVPTNVEGCTADLDDDGEPPCSLPREGALEDEDANRADLESLMAGLPDDTRLIDPAESLCDDESCASVLDGHAVFLDHIHLSAEASAALAGYFDDTVERLLAAA